MCRNIESHSHGQRQLFFVTLFDTICLFNGRPAACGKFCVSPFFSEHPVSPYARQLHLQPQSHTSGAKRISPSPDSCRIRNASSDYPALLEFFFFPFAFAIAAYCGKLASLVLAWPFVVLGASLSFHSSHGHGEAAVLLIEGPSSSSMSSSSSNSSGAKLGSKCPDDASSSSLSFESYV